MEDEIKEYIKRLWNERKISYNWTKVDEVELIEFIKKLAESYKSSI